VGNAGSGKSTLGRRIADRLGIPFEELDGHFHQPGWTPRSPDEFLEVVDEITGADAWVVDGNYRAVVLDGPVWERADTVVWLDLPRRTVMAQVVRRTVRRVLTRERLWNGNREPFGNLYRRDPQRSIVAWAWTQHPKYATRYEAAADDPRFGHLRFVRLRSHAEADAWLDRLPAGPA
jgi:adenylate kinase family enzyme